MGAGKATHVPPERIGAFTLVRWLAWPAMQQGVAYLKEISIGAAIVLY
jgi:hypothetical protein